MRWFDAIPISILAVGTIILGLAPFYPEPHIWEKLKLLSEGALTRPIDIFDLALHGSFPVLLTLKLMRVQWLKNHRYDPTKDT
jgi:hypothetical protein